MMSMTLSVAMKNRADFVWDCAGWGSGFLLQDFIDLDNADDNYESYHSSDEEDFLGA